MEYIRAVVLYPTGKTKENMKEWQTSKKNEKEKNQKE